MAIDIKRSIPNIITLFRFLLIVPSGYFLATGAYHLAFYFFVIAGLSDALDGFLARRLHCITRFGTIADPLADKLLMLVIYSLLTWIGKIPLWLFILVVFRDVWLVSGAILYFYLIARVKFKPTFISKCNTFCQGLLVFLMLFDLGFMPIPEIFIKVMIGVVAATTLISLIDYTWVWARRAWCATQVSNQQCGS